MADSMAYHVGLSCTSKSHEHASDKRKEGQKIDGEPCRQSPPNLQCAFPDRFLLNMDRILFERELEACRTKTEDISCLEILNYSVQAPFSCDDVHSGSKILCPMSLTLRRTQKSVQRSVPLN